MRSGIMYLDKPNAAWYGGISGYGWARWYHAFTSATSASAYDLRFNIYDTISSNGPSGHWNGMPLRCLSTASEGKES